MLDEIIAYHRWAAEGLLIVMVINLLIPLGLRSTMPKMVFWTRIGYFAFWALWTMTVFGGLIAWIFTLRHWPWTVIAMVLVATAVAFLDGYRAILLRRIWTAGSDGVALNTRWVGVEIVLALGALLYGVYGI